MNDLQGIPLNEFTEFIKVTLCKGALPVQPGAITDTAVAAELLLRMCLRVPSKRLAFHRLGKTEYVHQTYLDFVIRYLPNLQRYFRESEAPFGTYPIQHFDLNSDNSLLIFSAGFKNAKSSATTSLRVIEQICFSVSHRGPKKGNTYRIRRCSPLKTLEELRRATLSFQQLDIKVCRKLQASPPYINKQMAQKCPTCLSAQNEHLHMADILAEILAPEKHPVELTHLPLQEKTSLKDLSQEKFNLRSPAEVSHITVSEMQLANVNYKTTPRALSKFEKTLTVVEPKFSPRDCPHSPPHVSSSEEYVSDQNSSNEDFGLQRRGPSSELFPDRFSAQQNSRSSAQQNSRPRTVRDSRYNHVRNFSHHSHTIRTHGNCKFRRLVNSSTWDSTGGSALFHQSRNNPVDFASNPLVRNTRFQLHRTNLQENLLPILNHSGKK